VGVDRHRAAAAAQAAREPGAGGAPAHSAAGGDAREYILPAGGEPGQLGLAPGALGRRLDRARVVAMELDGGLLAIRAVDDGDDVDHSAGASRHVGAIEAVPAAGV